MSRFGRTEREEEIFIKENIKQYDRKATNAYGEIDFGGNSILPAKYVRVAENTDVEILYQLLVKHWNLRSPNLIISVIGGAKHFKLRSDLMTVFRTSLMKVAKKMNAWITTGGTQRGVAKHVGKAVEQYGTNTDEGDKVVSIGIVPWGVVLENEQLENDATGQFVKHYDAEEQDQNQKTILDHNHSHFILVDDGLEGGMAYGGEIELRTNLEGFIASKTTNEGINVAAVCVMVQGGPRSLWTTAQSISNGTPVVIVEGSGGVADVIVKAYKSDQHIFDEEWIVHHYPYITHWENGMLEKCTNSLNKCIANKNLLNVYSLNLMDPSWDLDTAILEALIKANQTNHPSDLLKLTLAWNRSDIAETLFLDEDKIRIRKKDLAEIFFEAIERNKHEFCKVLLDYGVHLKEFCTVTKLKILYASAPASNELRREMTKCEGNDDVRPIGRVMKEHLGHSYNTSVYEETKDSAQYSAIVGTVSHAGDQCALRLDDPYREIFQWAILLNYREIAKHVWEHMAESMAAAVMASKILKKMGKKMKYNDKKKQLLLADAAEYEALAAGILQKCFSKDPHNTCDLLTAERPKWGGCSCLQIAVAARDKHFVSMPGVRYLLENLWMDELANNTSSWHILLAGILPIFFLFTVSRKGGNLEEEALETIENEQREISTAGYEAVSGNDIEMVASGRQRRDIYGAPNRTDKKCWLITYYNAPVVKFLMNVVGFVIYLVLFAFIILSNFSVNSITPSAYEYVLFGWMITLSLEEIREIHGQQRSRTLQKILLHIRDPWNIMDIASMIIFYVGCGLRFNVRFLHVTLALYSIAFMIQCVRIVHLFTLHSVLGPKIIMIGKMLKDLMFFLFILMVFLLAYGVASQALLYPSETSFTEIIVGIIHRPYWQIYGELFLDEINYNPNASDYICSDTDANLPRCPQQNFLVPIISAVYLVLSNVLLLNLLIAMFSHTFETVRHHDEIWLFERYKLISSYCRRPPLVPPLIIISHALRFVRWCNGHGSVDTFDRDLKKKLPDENWPRLRKWERFRAEEFIREKHEEDDMTGDRQRKNLSSRIDIIMSATENIMKTTEDLKSRMQKLEESRSDYAQSKSG